MGDQIDKLIEEVIVDAYGEHEQLWSFRQVFEDDAGFPFHGRVVGVGVRVISVDLRRTPWPDRRVRACR